MPPAPTLDRGPSGRLAADHLTEIVAGLATATALWRPFARHDPCERTAVRLLAAGDLYEVWLLGWTAGQSVELHDHGDAAAAFRVVEGSLVEVDADPVSGRLTERAIGTGRTRVVAPGTIHDVRNDLSAPATSIHAYSPPLTTMRFYDPTTLEPTRSESVTRERSALPPLHAGALHPSVLGAATPAAGTGGRMPG